MAGTATTPTRPYRGLAADDRRAERRERLLAAGLELLGTAGHAGTTVRGVCRDAGLTPRYFYESFADLEALHVAILDRIVAEASAEVLAALAAELREDVRAKAHAAIDTFVRYLTEDPRRARIAAVEAQGSEALQQRRRAGMRLFARLIAEQARAFYGTTPEAEPLVDITAGLLVGGMAELLMTWLDGDLDTSREQLIEDFTDLFVITGEGAVALARSRTREERR